MERTIANLRDGSVAIADALADAVRSRIRPIMMSIVTTVAGLSPLVCYPGSGTELYRGLGAIVLFGLLFSTVITLTLIPSLLSLGLDFDRRFIHRRAAASEAGNSPGRRVP